MQRMAECQTVMLDRWQITVQDEEHDKSEPISRLMNNIPANIINNYFSIGVVSGHFMF